MKFKNLLFDIDGTLIDTFNMYMPALSKVLNQHGYQIAFTPALVNKLYGIAADDTLHYLKITNSDRPIIKREWISEAYQRLEQVQVIKDVPTILQIIAQHSDVNLGIVTSKTRIEYLQHFKNEYPFAKVFKTVITADDTIKHKPNPEPIKLALKQMHANPNESLYIGDQSTDEQAAHAAKVFFAAVQYNQIHSAANISKADLVLQSPTDLLKFI